MSGTLTISQGSNRTVKVISKSVNSVEVFTIPNNNNYQLILNEDCEIRISNNTVNINTSCQLQTDENPNITMKVLKMSSNETDINSRFNNNQWLREFNHEVRDNWDNVVYMHNTFYDCKGLTSVTLPAELPNVTYIGGMFYYCTNLTNITLPSTFPKVIHMGSMFYYCTNLTSITLPNELPKVTDIANMFNGCTSFNGNLSNTKFKSNVSRTNYDYNTPLWEEQYKPQFTL